VVRDGGDSYVVRLAAKKLLTAEVAENIRKRPGEHLRRSRRTSQRSRRTSAEAAEKSYALAPSRT
jgi:hypothetical protein